jgi:hypothetical protein
MQARRDASLLSTLMIVVGAVLLVVCLTYYVTTPPEPTFGSAGWFEANGERNDHEAVTVFCGMFGIFFVVTGVSMTRRMRRMAVELRSDQGHAMALGIRRGLESDGEPVAERLQQLQALHAQGLISADEMAAKRREILAAV